MSEREGRRGEGRGSNGLAKVFSSEEKEEKRSGTHFPTEPLRIVSLHERNRRLTRRLDRRVHTKKGDVLFVEVRENIVNSLSLSKGGRYSFSDLI